MGLSAAQARLLTITARKADCEFQSMVLSHQKIALARDMEKISDEYQNSLNQTRLVYDYYGAGASQIPLNYGLLMTPSVYNDYYPKLLTDGTNKVILNDTFAAAAKAAGIPLEGLSGTPSSDVRNAFIQALAGNNAISNVVASAVTSVVYGNTIGLGDTFSTTQATTTYTYDDIISSLQGWYSTDEYGIKLGSLDEIATNSCASASYLSSYSRVHEDATFGEKPENNKPCNGNNPNKSGLYKNDGSKLSPASINFANLLRNNESYNLVIDSYYGTITDVAYMQQLLVKNEGSFLAWMDEGLQNALGNSTEVSLAIQYANDVILGIIYPNDDIQDKAAKTISAAASADNGNDKKPGYNYDETTKQYVAYTNSNDNLINDFEKEANKYVGMLVNLQHSDNGGIAINLNNLAQVFMTAFVSYMQGLDESPYTFPISSGKKDSYNLFDSNKDTFSCTVSSNTLDMGDQDIYAGFYDALFNNICMNGWIKNSNVDDPEYMQAMLKNGSAFISSMGNDGCYYQSNYTTDQYISEVTDDTAVAQAEAKYNSEKAKIQNKEDIIDLRMKNLDTEITSLTTEYDSTKNIIKTAIEKSFKRYEA